MKKIKKLGADAVQEAAIGHNLITKEIEASFLKIDADIVEQIAQLNEERKANLRDAKESGMSKMAIRQATKEARMSLESRQSLAEVEAQKKHYLAVCREVGLFVPEEEEAA